MATSRTRNLRLFLSSGLSTEAKANLEILDRLGGVYQVDNSEAVNIRSKSDIRLLPGDPAAGGAGNSNVFVGSESTPVKEFKVYATTFELNGSLRLPDYDVPLQNRKYLTIRYDSSAQGADDTAANRTLSLDVQGGDRSLILAQDLELAGSFRTKLNTTAITDVTLPTTGVLATLEGTETLKNKTINVGSPDSNVITGLTDGSVASNAAIDIRKISRKPDTNIANLASTRLDDILAELQADIDTRATAADFLAHTNDTSAHGVISDIVGINDVQTLTNKTLSSPHFQGTPTGLQKSHVDLANVDNYSAAQLAALPQTLTNKNLSGYANAFSDVPRNALLLTGQLKDSDWSSVALDKLTYAKVNLTGQLVNADIANTADIAYTKLNLTEQVKNTDWSNNSGDRLAGTKVNANFGSQFASSESGFKIGQTFKTTLGIQSQTQNLDFRFPSNAGGQNYVLITDGLGNTSWSASQAGGSVSKVGLTAPNIFSVTTRDGSGAVIPANPGDSIPFITATGQFDVALANQAADRVFASPIGTTGTPSFRALQETDLPAPLNSSANRNQLISDQVNNTIQAATGLTWAYNSGTRQLTPTLNIGAFSTTDLPEGSRLYYTDARVNTKVKGMIAANDGVTSGIVISHGSGPDSISFSLRQLTVNTDNITEGATNKFFSDELAQDAINALLLDSTEIAKAYDDAGNSLSFSLKTTGVASGSYGDAAKTVTLAVDNKGRLTSASHQDIAIASTQITDFSEAVQDVVGSALVGQSNDIAPTYTDGSNSLTLALRNEAITSKTEVSPANEDYILISDASDSDNLKKISLQSVANLSGANFTATWATADGTSKSITHNLGSRDVLIQIYSLDTFEDILVDSVVRTTLNVIDLTASEAPTGSGWKVLIRRI